MQLSLLCCMLVRFACDFDKTFNNLMVKLALQLSALCRSFTPWPQSGPELNYFQTTTSQFLNFSRHRDRYDRFFDITWTDSHNQCGATWLDPFSGHGHSINIKNRS